MQFTLKHYLLLTILGSCVLGLSFPFTGGLVPLVFIAFVPLFLINFEINKLEKRRFLVRLVVNYLYFIIFNLITSWWIYYASPVGMLMAVFANSLLMTLPFFFAGFITKQLGENKGVLALIALWMSYEWCHFYWELSWPWMNLGHFLGEAPKMIQWYEYSGVSGGSLWILLINVLAYYLVRNVWLKKESFKIQAPILLFLGLGILIPISSSLIIYYTYEEEVNPVDIVVVQPNIEPHKDKFSLPVDYQINKMFYLAQTKMTDSTDLVVCPETAIPIDVAEENIDSHKAIQLCYDFVDSHKIGLLIGSGTLKMFKEENSVASIPFNSFGKELWYERYNTALMFNPNMPLELYHKSKLVLGGEKIPFVGMFPFLKEYSIELGGSSGVLGIGEEPLVLNAGGIDYAPIICFESVYGDYTSYFVRKGAEIICVITNDGWWSDTPGYHQHRMFSRIRAIENRRSVARSANTGISCFIDQKGEIIEEIGWDEEGAISTKLNRNTEFTFFTKYGDVLGRISSFLAIAMFIYAFSTWLRSRNQST